MEDSVLERIHQFANNTTHKYHQHNNGRHEHPDDPPKELERRGYLVLDSVQKSNKKFSTMNINNYKEQLRASCLEITRMY